MMASFPSSTTRERPRDYLVFDFVWKFLKVGIQKTRQIDRLVLDLRSGDRAYFYFLWAVEAH